MKILAQSKSKLILIIIGLLLIASWFYWFQWRPSEIRKECAKERTESFKGSEHPNWSVNEWAKALELSYEICLNKKGLK